MDPSNQQPEIDYAAKLDNQYEELAKHFPSMSERSRRATIDGRATRPSGQWIVEEGKRIGAQLIPLTLGEDPAAFLYDEDGLPNGTSNDNPQKERAMIAISDLREQLSEVITGLATDGKAVRITDDGKPVAVLMDYAAFEALIEDLDDASDYRALERAAEEGPPTIEELIEQGRATPARKPSSDIPPAQPLPRGSDLTMTEVLTELRDDH